MTIVNNNSVLQQSTVEIDRFYENRQGNKNELMTFGKVNFAQLAEQFGCRGMRAEYRRDIQPALEEAMSEIRPVVVDVVTDPEHPAPEPWWAG